MVEKEKVLAHGYDAIGWGGINAGCRHFFGYPITPQNEITEFFARELPPRGGRFVQAESESAVGAMLFGAGAAGVRTMTSTAGPGWGLMQEMLSHIAFCEVPAVVVNVQRGGPGQGTTRHSQTDYVTSTRGGGQGGYKSIVLTPSSVQECHDLLQLAFHLSDKYRILAVLLCDGILIQIAESVSFGPLDFGPLPAKDWSLISAGKKGGKRDMVHSTRGLMLPGYRVVIDELHKKYRQIVEEEVRYDTYLADDAELLLVAYGYVGRCCEEAVNMARSDGLKVGFIRPITVWPFPYGIIKEKASQGCRFLVVEDSMGQMIEDVMLGAEGRAEIDFLGLQARHQPGELGMIFPETVYREIRRLYGRE